jgi:hypothetical protein
MSLRMIVLIDEGATAGVDLDAKFGEDHVAGCTIAVSLNEDGEAILPTEDGERIRGFAARKAAEGEDVQIVLDGVVPVKVAAEAGIEKYTALRANDDGTVSAAEAGDEIVGFADEEPEAGGDIIRARVQSWGLGEFPE